MIAALTALLLGTAPAGNSPELLKAEAVIDAFYAFDPARLGSHLTDAGQSRSNILYYQGWAEGGHYRLLRRQPCRWNKADEIACAITVKDDLIAALGTGYDVTDVFHFKVADGKIVAVRTSSDDPPQMRLAFEWLRKERPTMWTGVCRQPPSGDASAQACVRAVVAGFREWRALQPR